ncbi:hypothetical protein PHYSODRAFT_333132 [Phytophthora sojae]|uniref:Uncharacterized protein n=1 Tax=Phytophthora sojae (strain P6497) TaxID=1094619 RepID=G4ZQ95_PHYSP|nr:hypothetical protein PHYSODRAFT_333132 [Phytophthora sojae]EGZ14806.1 hypothetical protein PHYSODRAFT_333132 [Phytophthora sojae]|eukprot:XP_009528555.1 hypothetical protein PHYSODRAFT_333132 [Phytophthora sojae]
MKLFSFLLAAVVAATLTSVEAGKINHDKVQPFPQPVPITASEKAAIKFKPSLQIVKGCHPYPVVNAAGETSGGLKGTGKPDGECKGSSLGSQVSAALTGTRASLPSCTRGISLRTKVYGLGSVPGLGTCDPVFDSYPGKACRRSSLRPLECEL